jgi:hypothetical protein
MIEKEFVPYQIAVDMKSIGFDEPCLKTMLDFDITYESDVKIPLYQQAFRWFREKYNLFGCIDLHVSTPLHWFIRIDKIDINDYLYHSEDGNIQYNTYEEAELACLRKLIELTFKSE